jgi:hypothetical protein
MPVWLPTRFRNLRSFKRQVLNIIRCEPSFEAWWSVTILPKLKSPKFPGNSGAVMNKAKWRQHGHCTVSFTTYKEAVPQKGQRPFLTTSSVIHLSLTITPSDVTQCVPLATEPGISLIILTPMRILQRNLNRGIFVVWEMKRNVSVACL